MGTGVLKWGRGGKEKRFDNIYPPMELFIGGLYVGAMVLKREKGAGGEGLK